MGRGVTQAVVLAGGEGTRLRPLTNTRPKPLLPVLGRPCVEWVLRSLGAAGIKHAYLACGYRSEDLVRGLGNGENLGIELTYAFEDVPMGTAGAVKLLEAELGDTFVVASGDVLSDVDMQAVIDFHGTKKATVTMALTEVDKPTEFGIVGLDRNGRIARFKEKPRPEEVFSNLINAGIYVLEKEALSFVPRSTKYDFSKNLFPDLLGRGYPLFGSPLKGMWKDIGRPADLLDANIRMAERKGKAIKPKGAKASGKICAGSFSADGATLRGPCYFGDGVSIGKSSIVSASCINQGGIVGLNVVLTRSLLLDACQIKDNCSVEGCVVGAGCIIGPGVVLKDSVLGDGVVIEGPKSLEGEVVE
jgi:mannose-1-phosphate guanylyltransferase